MWLMFLGGFDNLPAGVIWGSVAIVLGAVIYLLGLVLSVAAVGAGIFTLVKKGVTAIIGVAIVMVLFDILCHVLWPVAAWVISLFVSSMDQGWDVAMIQAGMGVVGLIIGEIWSIILILLWGGIAALAIVERRKQQAVD